MAAAEPDSLTAALRQAGERKVADSREWRTLGHYRPAGDGWVSLVDDPAFFLSPRGRRDPAAELEATLRAFLSPPGTNLSTHAACRFPARLAFLKDQLGLAEADLPVPICPAFQRTLDTLRPAAAALVFPSAFMNGPGSMFGHTLLVFDGADRNRLLSRAVSYAARMPEHAGPFTTFAGIFGVFPGLFAYQPYYEKAQQYGDLGHRDVWEYELDLTPAELERALAHAWELQGIWSRYFFFDENCAFNLLYLLDAARPALRLTDDMPWFIVPIDTVRRVQAAGLVREVTYRPSPVTVIRARADGLERSDRALALALAGGTAATGTAARAAAPRETLELAAEYLKYLKTEGRVDESAYRSRLLPLLRERSALGPAVGPDVPRPAAPDEGHRPARVGLGVGVREGEPFALARYRLVYHALEDPDDGFTPGAHIQFLNTEVRWSEDYAGLQRFDLADVVSIAPRDDLFQPSCWKARIGTERDPVDPDQWLAVGSAGSGRARRVGRNGLLWGLLEAEAGWREALEGDTELAAGPAAGLLLPVGRNGKQLLQARGLYAGLEADTWIGAVSWIQDLRLRRDVSVGTEVRWDKVDGRSAEEYLLRLHVFW